MKKKVPRIYSEEFKWRVVQEVLSGKFTKEEARRVYQIPSNCAILYWMRSYSGITNYRSGGDPFTSTQSMSKSKKEKALEKEVLQLKEALKKEQLRADLWQKMIEVAEEELKLDIKKKFGAKPLRDSGKKGGTP